MLIKLKLNWKKKVNNEINESIDENNEIVKDNLIKNKYTEELKQIGGGLGIIFLEAKANFSITDNISLSPSIDYNFSNYLKGFKISIDGHYNFFIGEKFIVYPLAGFNYHNYVYYYYDDYPHYSGLGINIGGGINLALSDKIKLYSELRYVSGLAISAGVLISLQ